MGEPHAFYSLQVRCVHFFPCHLNVCVVRLVLMTSKNMIMTTVQTAVEQGNASALREYIRLHGNNIVQVRYGDRDQTLLHHAGNAEVAQILVDHGGDVNAQDNRGVTPLHTACAKGKFAVVQFLVEDLGLALA